ncbi:MAG: phosphoglycerate mutase family protein [Sphingomicrobium sp.]
MLRSIALAVILSALTACVGLSASSSAGPVPTYYVIRHLQKAAGDDPPLSAEGAANAQRLAGLLGDKGIAAIFATDTKRARQTAEPLAALTGVAIQVYDPRDNEALARRAAASSGSVLIVGHSNTVPAIVGALHGIAPTALDESDYGTIFAVARSDGLTTPIIL